MELPGRFSREAPVEAVVGGRRQGLSFLARISNIDGERLERSPLVEIRLLLGAHQQRLVMPPGFTPLRAASYEAVLGRVLGTRFEQKCLTCHGIPRNAANERGVQCESCHGPGQAHCRKGLTCTTCHNPHRDAKENDAAYTRACRNCHGVSSANHAEICPVNQNDGCIGCHMPKQVVNGFPMADHWIRVHPELPAPPHKRTPTLRTRVVPVSEFLSVISVTDERAANDILRQLESGAAFFDLARKYSTDASAPNGGYIGEAPLADLDTVLAAGAKGLRYGETSRVLSTSGKFMILARMPVDFRYRALELEREAGGLRTKGDLRGVLEKYQAAIRLYPLFFARLF